MNNNLSRHRFERLAKNPLILTRVGAVTQFDLSERLRTVVLSPAKARKLPIVQGNRLTQSVRAEYLAAHLKRC